MQVVPHAPLGSHDRQEEVGARGEVLSLAADHQTFEIKDGAIQSFVEHAKHIGIEGVHLGMELDTSHAVAQVNQRGAQVLLDQLTSSLLLLEQNQTYRAWDGFIGAAGGVVDGHL